MPSGYFCTLAGRMELFPVSARNPSSVCFADTADVTGQRPRFLLCESSAAVLGPFGSRLDEPQGNPFGVCVQPCHRPPKGQRFLMLESRNFSHHRRPVHTWQINSERTSPLTPPLVRGKMDIRVELQLSKQPFNFRSFHHSSLALNAPIHSLLRMAPQTGGTMVRG